VIAQDVQQRLLHGRNHGIPALDLERPVDVGQRLTDGEQRCPSWVPQLERSTKAERLAVNLKGMVARLVLDPGVASKGEELLIESVGLTAERHRRVSEEVVGAVSVAIRLDRSTRSDRRTVSRE